MSKLDISEIIKANEAVTSGGKDILVLQPFQVCENLDNEAVFFIKPEITSRAGVNLSGVVQIVSNAFDKFKIEVASLSVLGASYLEKNNIIGQHYGVINAISRNGIDELSEDSKAKLNDFFPEAMKEGALVLGGHQFLEKFDFFTAQALGVLWDALNGQSKKLASGTYAEQIAVGTQNVILLNGFHLQQLLHFYAPKHSIILMTVRSPSAWSVLRDELIGETDPNAAAAGSIRRTFLENKEKLGLPVVNKGENGVHLSAGPLEGLVEIIRFCSDYSKNELITPDQTVFGKMLASSGLNDKQIEMVRGNPDLITNGKMVSAFDLTEKVNSDEAAKVIKQRLAA